MCLRIVIRLLVSAALLAAGSSFAQANWPHGDTPLTLKPVAVVYFTAGVSSDSASAIERVIRRARDDFHLTIDAYALAHESDLPKRIDKIADEDIGLIIIVAPNHLDGLMKIPGLYPDIRFLVIGTPAPLYFSNVHSVIFRDEEGVFLMGALSALHSKTGSLAFISTEDSAPSRNLTYIFSQGARYVDPQARIIHQLGGKTRRSKSPRAENADIQFVLDEELLPGVLRSAKEEKRLVIPFGRDMTATYPGVVLTSLLKHYDHAVYTALQSYRQRGWKSGVEVVGIGDGYIDYVLDNDNKALLPKEEVNRIETIKDLVSQGILQITPLAQ